MLTASDGCVPTPSETYDPTEFALVEKAAFDCLMGIKDGECELFDFPSITHGIDRRLRSRTERIKSGDVVIEVMVIVIVDTKREMAQ